MTPESLSVTSFESLRKQARQWLKSLRSGDTAALERFRKAYPQAGSEPGLREVQHALARELGFAGWPQLKIHAQARDAERRRQAQPPLQRLFAAAQQGDAAAVAAVLDLHPTLVNVRGTAPGSFGKRTALHYGVEHAAVVKLLLERGADPNLRDDGDNATPLHFAAEHQDLDVVRLLVEHGADPVGEGTMHELDVLGWCVAWQWITPDPAVVEYLLAHGARYSMFSAVALGALAELRQIVAREPDALNRPMDATNERRRPLHLAVTKKQHGALALLLELGADTEARDRRGLTPLDQAALLGDNAAVDLLIAHGARLELPAAVALGRSGDIERLLAADPRCLKPGGRWDTLIVRAAESAPGPVVEMLLRCGASANATRPVEKGATALHVAALRGNAEAVRVLLAHGADPTRRDAEHGSTPLGWAAWAGQEATRQLLLEVPVDIFDAIVMDRAARLRELLATDPAALHRTFGEFSGLMGEGHFITPLGCAVRHNRPAMVALLLERGAQVLDAPDGETLLEIAEKRGYEEVASLLRPRKALAAPAASVWAEAERVLRSGDAERLERLIAHHEALFRDGRPPAMPGGAAPEYDARDAREVIRRNHQFDSWENYEAFRERMQIALSPDTRFEAAADAIVQDNLDELRWLLRAHPELVHECSPRRHRAQLIQYTRPHAFEYFRRVPPAHAQEIARLLTPS